LVLANLLVGAGLGLLVITAPIRGLADDPIFHGSLVCRTFQRYEAFLFIGDDVWSGGTAFGMAIRHVGISLTYAIAVGISCVLGTLVPPMVNGSIKALMHNPGISQIITGVILGAIGIAICGIAGRKKELDLSKGTDDNYFPWPRVFRFAFWLVCCLRFTGLRLMRVHRLQMWQKNSAPEILNRM